MKNKIIFRITLLIGMLACSCSRDQNLFLEGNNSTIGIVCAVPGIYDYIADFSGKNITYSNSRSISYFDFDYTTGGGGSITKFIGIPANLDVPIKIFSREDTLHTIFNEIKRTQPDEYYTLYLAGEPEQVDAFLVKESTEFHADSVMGVRIINLSKTSGAISVNLEGGDPGSEVTSLKYKEYTSFKTYNVKSKQTSYIFEFRDSVSGELLASYNFDLGFNSIPRFRNVTLVLRGKLNDYPGLEVVRANNY